MVKEQIKNDNIEATLTGVVFESRHFETEEEAIRVV